MAWRRNKLTCAHASPLDAARARAVSGPPVYSAIQGAKPPARPALGSAPKKSSGSDTYTLAGDTMPDGLTEYETTTGGSKTGSRASSTPQDKKPNSGSIYGSLSKFKHLLPDEQSVVKGKPPKVPATSTNQGSSGEKSTDMKESSGTWVLNSYGSAEPTNMKGSSGPTTLNPTKSAQLISTRYSSGFMGSDLKSYNGKLTNMKAPQGSVIPMAPNSLYPGKLPNSIRPSFSTPRPNTKDTAGSKNHSLPPSTSTSTVNWCPSGFGWIKTPGGHMCQEEEHAISDQELKEDRGRVRFRFPQRGIFPGLYPNHWLGPYRFDRRFGKHGVWRYDGPLPKANLVPDAWIADQPSLSSGLVWYPVLKNHMIGWDGYHITLGETIDEFESGRSQREAVLQANRYLSMELALEDEMFFRNMGSGIQRRWDQPR